MYKDEIPLKWKLSTWRGDDDVMVPVLVWFNLNVRAPIDGTELVSHTIGSVFFFFFFFSLLIIQFGINLHVSIDLMCILWCAECMLKTKRDREREWKKHTHCNSNAITGNWRRNEKVDPETRIYMCSHLQINFILIYVCACVFPVYCYLNIGIAIKNNYAILHVLCIKKNNIYMGQHLTYTYPKHTDVHRYNNFNRAIIWI